MQHRHHRLGDSCRRPPLLETEGETGHQASGHQQRPKGVRKTGTPQTQRLHCAYHTIWFHLPGLQQGLPLPHRALQSRKTLQLNHGPYSKGYISIISRDSLPTTTTTTTISDNSNGNNYKIQCIKFMYKFAKKFRKLLFTRSEGKNN